MKHNLLRHVVFGLISSVLILNSAWELYASDAISSDQTEFFEARIRPVLVKHCYECHSTESGKSKGGLRLDSKQAMLSGGDSGPAIVPGKPEESLLLLALRYDELEMPPKQKLPETIITDFDHWVRSGAPDPRVTVTGKEKKAGIDLQSSMQFWAFQKPVVTPSKQVQNNEWARGEIDRYVLNRLEQNGLKPSEQASKRTLIRRAYFDLIGLPPESADVEAFVNDNSPGAFNKVVESLLASKHYGERWGRHWLDSARYAEDQAHTFKARMYPQGYLYRDWVIQSLNDDMPYDQFLRLQVAGDLLVSAENPANRAALGMFALGPVYYQDNGEKDKALADEWDDRLDTLMRGTQALTVACARCHDHKYDPISTADYYGLAGVFASTEYAELPVVPETVVIARQKADQKVVDQQLLIDAFQARHAPVVRLKLANRISDYLFAAWELSNSSDGSKSPKNQVKKIAQQKILDEELLQRWVKWLAADKQSGAVDQNRPYFQKWLDFQKSIAGELNHEQKRSKVHQFSLAFQSDIEKILPKRDSLKARFGENFAFIPDSDRSDPEPGTIPLGNLFDDPSSSPLETALISDSFRSVATSNSLGVDRVLQGWGETATIADGIRLNLKALGSDSNSHGAVTNDAWSNANGGISTTGKKSRADLPRTEQGIGMHANALVTFDLMEIRKAGLIPTQQRMKFKVDRAGINDDSFGQGSSVHIGVILSKPHTDKSRYDAIVASYLNGQPLKIIENDTTYYFDDALPKPLIADGQFASFDVDVPPEARYLTIVVTGAETSDKVNTINSDHAVLSNARLEYEPTASQLADFQKKQQNKETDEANLNQLRADALLLSEVFDERGLLGLPSGKIADYLSSDQSEELKSLQAELSKLKKAAEAIAIPKAHTLSEGEGKNLNIYLSGDPKKQGDVAVRSFPAILTGGKRQAFPSNGSGRRELADRLTSIENPLTARVIVNRIWAGHFGFGLVRTLNNFGSLGDRPSHPELLDYLACQLMKNQWSLKSIHREIMLSATYQQSSAVNPQYQEIDPENRLFWRMNRRRLEIEPWRDSVLSVTGQLDKNVGGPSSRLDNNNRRRTLYGYVSRHKLDDLLRLFDFPDPNITAGQRSATTVPLQQLFILNSDFMINQAKELASRLAKDEATNQARIQRAFALLFSRSPSEQELETALSFLNADTTDSDTKLTPLEQFSLALLGTNEFVYVD